VSNKIPKCNFRAFLGHFPGVSSISPPSEKSRFDHKIKKKIKN